MKARKIIATIIALILCAGMLMSCDLLSALQPNNPNPQHPENPNNPIQQNPVVSAGFYRLQEAYDLDLLTYEDIWDIALFHQGQPPYISTIWYPHTPQNPEFLSEETENKIKQTFLDEYYEKNNDSYIYTIDDIQIEGYYGTYNGAVAVYLQGLYCYGEALWTETVADVNIHYRNGNYIRVWVEGEILPVEPATVQQGTYITNDELGIISLMLYGENKFIFAHSEICWFMEQSGDYIVENGQLILYYGYPWSDGEEYARFDIEQVKLVLVAGYGIAVNGMPSGTIFRFIGDLDRGTYRQIKQDFENAPDKHFYFTKYLGNNNGCEVFFIEGCDTALWSIEVAGYVFSATSISQIIVYKDGKFYQLAAAYEQGLLTEQNIADIWAKYQ